MTSFKFLHAADLHLGSPFRGLALKDAGVARRFAEASRKAFSELVTRAIAEQVAFAVIAGDVYDGDWKDNTIGLFFNREVARLEKAGIPVFLLRGNHDAESVITRSVTLPASVSHFDTRRASTFRLEHLKVALHGQGFAKRETSDNLALAYPRPVAGWFNIGVLHTSLTGRPNHDSYAPCTPEHLRNSGYDYWALGHVHEFEIVGEDPPIVFPGNLQGRSVRECGEKGAVLVSVDGGRIAGIERLVVDQARWAVCEIDIAGLASEGEILQAVEAAVAPVTAAAGDRLVALRIRLAGESPLHAALRARRDQLRDEIQAACHRAGSELWLEKLELATVPVAAAETPAAPAAFDIDAMLAAAAEDPALRHAVDQVLRELGAKLPRNLGGDEEDLAQALPSLLEEARDLLRERALGDA